MAKRKRLIPFGIPPGHWGIAGKMRELAEAEYYLDGEDLERRRIEINVADRSPKDLKLATLDLDLKYKKISEEFHEREKVAITIEDEKERDIALLAVDKKYGKITDAEYDKQVAGVKDEPYIRVVEIVTDPGKPSYGGIIFDYNEAFVLYLEEHGYGPHPDSDDTINEWFNDLCKNVALEAFDGLGDFADRVGGGQRRRTKSTMSEDVVFKEDLKPAAQRPEQDD